MSEVEEIVIGKLRQRAEVGKRKYNTTMERKDLTRKAWLIHAQEECLDLAVYLQKCIILEEEETEEVLLKRQAYDRFKSIVCKFDEFMCNNEVPENVHSYWSEMFNMFPARMEEE
jgi:hypothetical protein|tara:strand:+ start:2131 stop:2475 length:345 start_codon:yes stop_codon:yes gene_type:complete